MNPGHLRNCFARFIWDSCACDPEHEDEITLGGQLNVGTVFSKFLAHPSGDLTWDNVDIWVKMKISDDILISGVFLNISDMSGNALPSTDQSGSFATPDWAVIHHRKSGNWSGWDETNLRATLNFLGTTDDATVGLVTVDIEWFAIRLRSQVDPE